jgi:hypothetical protein
VTKKRRRPPPAPLLLELLCRQIAREADLFPATGYFFPIRDTPGFAAMIAQETEAARCEAGTNFDPNRDLSPLAEVRKRIYLGEGRPDKCLCQMTDETYGYHPKSVACARCRDCVGCVGCYNCSGLRNAVGLRDVHA